MRSLATPLVLACLGLIALNGCAGELPSTAAEQAVLLPTEGPASVVELSAARDSARRLMRRAGCTPLDDRGIVGAIALPLPDGRFLRFDCRSARPGAARGAARAYQRFLHPAGRGSSLVAGGAGMGDGFWWLVDMWTDCSGTSGGGGGYYTADGAYVLPEIGTRCTTYFTYTWISEESPGPPPSGGGLPEGGGGSGGTPTTSPTVAPCPETDPACWKYPSASERALIRHAWQTEFADSSAITDPIARRECREARQWLDAAMATLDDPARSQIFVGTYNLAQDGHSAQTDAKGTRFHIDPDLMTKAAESVAWEKELLAFLLHEAAHLQPQRRTHPNADAYLERNPDPQVSPGVIYANDPWFRTIHSEQAGSACVNP